MRSKGSPWLLIVLILIGALVGGFAGEFLSRYSYFRWMTFGGVNGYRDLLAFSLNAVDFRILKFGFDFALRVNAGSIIGIILSILLYVRL